MKGALLGFGKVAEAAHAPAFKNLADRLSIQAVADEREDRLRLAERLLPGVRCYRAAEELLAREKGLDFADIATPPSTHPRLAALALEAGLHALVEKPLALDARELEGMKALARRTGRCLYTVHNWKFAPLFLKLQALIGDGLLGEIRHVELHTIRTQPAAVVGEAGNWRADPSSGGILVDHGWHAFYLLLSLSGQEPVSASCLEGRLRGITDGATVLVQLERATGLIHLTWGGAARSNRGVVYGSKATAEILDDRLAVTLKGGESRSYEFPQRISAGSAHPDWFETMLHDFESEMQDPERRGSNLAEAEATYRLLAAAGGSLRSGGARAAEAAATS